MDSNLLSISKIFTERIFRIPDYQRGFAWTERQLKDFLNDLIQLDIGSNHYTGVLTLEAVPKEIYNNWVDDKWIIESKSYEPFYIVDGQQRLTTTIILIQSILEILKSDDDTLNYTTKEDIRKKFIFDKKNKGISRSYIFGYEKDNPSYTFLKTNVFKEETDLAYDIEETVYTNNLENAKNFFVEYLKDLSKKDLEILFTKITQKFLFNIYSISSDIDVFVAFETMNNRGKPLSHLELLKNRLIYLSTKFNVQDFEKGSLRTRINECWKAIYHNLGRNKKNPLDDDTFLVNHFLIYFGSELFEDRKDLESFHMSRNMRHYYQREYSNYLLEKKFTSKNIKSTENKISIKDIDEYVKSLKSSVVAWYKIFNPKNSDLPNEIKKWLDKLNRIGIHDAAPLILAFFQREKNNKKRLELLKAIEKLKFLFSMIAYRYYIDFDSAILLRLAIDLNSKKTTSDKVIIEIETLFNKQLERDTSIKHSKDFRNSGFYNWTGIRYFLFEYDLSLSENSKSDRRKLIWNDFYNEDYSTVEHIYPRNGRKQCWTKPFQKYTTKERGIIKNSLGNLLPLSRRKNSSLSNNCFNDKIYNSKNSVGFRFGCYAENEIAKYKNWTAIEILERGIDLLTFLENRWGIKIGTEKDKISLLNIGFVIKKEKLPLTKAIHNAGFSSKNEDIK